MTWRMLASRVAGGTPSGRVEGEDVGEYWSVILRASPNSRICTGRRERRL